MKCNKCGFDKNPSNAKFCGKCGYSLAYMPKSEPNGALRRKVYKIIADHLVVDISEINDNAVLSRDLGADSLDAVELIMAMEQNFDITIPDEAAERIRTVGDIVSYIDRHIY